jgi:hypothetical protein
LEKSLRRSSFVTLPTARAASAAAGDDTVCPAGSNGKWLPAAATNSVPYRSVSVLTAADIGSVPSVGPPPKLMCTTRAPCWAAHSMPARMADSGQPPSESAQTLPTSSRASGATPR